MVAVGAEGCNLGLTCLKGLHWRQQGQMASRTRSPPPNTKPPTAAKPCLCSPAAMHGSSVDIRCTVGGGVAFSGCRPPLLKGQLLHQPLQLGLLLLVQPADTCWSHVCCCAVAVRAV